MARTKISEFSATPNDNTDIDGIDIAEGCAPSGINNAIRELMSQLKDFQTGSAGDPFNGAINGTVGATTPSTVVATQVDITAQGDLRLQDTTGGQYVALQAPGTVATSYTLTLPVDDGTAGQALITDGSGVLSWSSAASGDVYGPGSATDNAVARYDGTTGKIIQNSAVTIGDDGATVIAANSSSDGLRITQTGAGNALLVEDSANPDATPFVINNSGAALVGVDTTRTLFTAYTPNLQIEGTTFSASSQSITLNINTAASPTLWFAKSRGTTNGSNTIVSANDALGVICFNGADGTDIQSSAAQISAAVDGTPGADDMPGRLVFSTTADGASSPTERMRIDAAGNVGVGTTAQAFEKLVLAGTFPSGSANTRANVVRGTIPSSTTGLFNGFRTEPTTQAASFTLTAMTHFSANQGTLGAGSAVTNQYGFIAESNLTGATNNYGFIGNIASGTGRYNFYAAGTADNYFAGNVAIGTTTTNNGYGGVASLNLKNASTITFNNASGAWNTSTAGGAITYFTDNNLYIDAKDSTSLIRFRVNGANVRGEIASNGVWSLGAAPGAESLRVTPVASAVNYWNFYGGATGGSVQVYASGTDTNISVNYVSKGASSHLFYTNFPSSAPQFNIAGTASAVDYLQVTGNSAGFPNLSAQGASANVSIVYSSKGTGGHNFTTNGTSINQFVISNTASAVNYLQVTGGATGSPATMFVAGSDTNIDLALSPKGTGNVRFGTHTASSDVAISGYITIKDSAGNTRKLAVIS